MNKHHSDLQDLMLTLQHWKELKQIAKLFKVFNEFALEVFHNKSFIIKVARVGGRSCSHSCYQPQYFLSDASLLSASTTISIPTDTKHQITISTRRTLIRISRLSVASRPFLAPLQSSNFSQRTQHSITHFRSPIGTL